MSIVSFGLLLMGDAGTAPPAGGIASAGPIPAVATARGAAPDTGLRVMRLHVEDLTREGCARQIREALQPLAGVSDVQTDVETKNVAVTYDPSRTTTRAGRSGVHEG